ncbi:uncharacterized protein F5Z01DRAFT_643718 [Emericellopsis atlantica]|uniref:C3H1-type domain-containing protein n=1 Tax=Emericellopsis atlantica TaxID=2614577 RepID=A0A9P7ZUJ3_9HYPO|nr:uncharacterized protein F5Z01DRAFT_643718 [Emericellopsis atlantica]KAG9258604.1 hypothetical protein F5Z01DRAFT_643718 [Emericellopsis atlantica]
MSYSSHSYSFQGGCLPPQQNAGLPFPVYNAASPLPPGNPGSSSSYPSQNAFDTNRNMIPGLGRGFHPTRPAEPTTTDAAKAPNATTDDDDMDEGEISENDDIYGSEDQAGEVTENAQTTDGTTTAADRGSYSPHLSPRELEQTEPPIDEQVTSLPDTKAPSIHELHSRVHAAILQLQALNVEPHHYLDEGIDPKMLEDLFREVGLPFIPKPASGLPVNSPPETVEKAAPPTETAPKQLPASKPIVPTDSAAESRKDRIARLLAAKGSTKSANVSSDETSKTGPAAPSSSAVSETTPAITTTPSPAAQAQAAKSELLRQKMEALKKRRERQARAPETAATDENGTTAVAPSPKVPAHAAATVSESLPSMTNPAGSTPTQRPQAAVPVAKRPVASDFDNEPDVPAKRLFGQHRPAQPLLIDVSDDDDDEAMDLDSPEMRPASIDRPSSPFKIPALKSLHQPPSSHAGSPAVTPPATTPGVQSYQDKMKEIEAMKRSIAEREALRKAKQSRPASPAAATMGSPQRASSLPCSENGLSPTISPVQLQQRSQPLPKASSFSENDRLRQSRSQSRIASDRILEKEMRLKALESQMKRLQRELDQEREEEERLRSEQPDALATEGQPDAEHRPQSPTMLSTEASQSEEVPRATTEAGSRLELDSQKHAEPAPVLEASSTPQQEISIRPREPALEESESSPNAQTIAAASGSLNEAIGSAQVEGDAFMHGSDPLPEQEGEPMVTSSSGESSSGEDEESSDESDEEEVQGVSVKSPVTNPISSGAPLSVPTSPSEVDKVPLGQYQPFLTCQQVIIPEKSADAKAQQPPAQQRSYIPYESPLKQFRAYRLHPSFAESVPGGLRSLTYSNNIDVNKELCPDDLAGQACPRGDACQFQHLASMQTPDDQILVQLGDARHFEGQERRDYIKGLCAVLGDLKTRQIKDFDATAQSIIDFRAKFRKDPYRILPLGDVSI